MSDLFGPAYAGFYDATYRGKDYEAECDLLENIFQQHSAAAVRNVLDLGAGTGNHAIPLAERGYSVTAVDRSKDMLDVAKTKPGAAEVKWIQADVREVELAAEFDAALMLFAVLGYQLTNQDVVAALRVARSHMNLGGLFVCDAWYGPGVLAMRPESRFKVVETAEATYLRSSQGTLDVLRHRCSVEIETWRLRGDRLEGHSQECHEMRFFFPLELEQFLSLAGLELVTMVDFDRPATQPDSSTWNVLVIARAV